MTQAHERFENSALVEAWLKEPTFLEPVDEGRVAAIVHHTPQARRWPPQVDLGRFAPMLNASKLVAASVILALTGGLLLNFLPSGQQPAPISGTETSTEAGAASEPAPATTPDVAMELPSSRITFPDDLPDGVAKGTLETPAGTAQWVHVADPEQVPFTWVTDVLPWGDGIAAYQGYGPPLFASEDGVTWEPIDVPDEASSRPGGTEVSFVNDTYFVAAPQGRVWASSGPGDEWRELDTTAVAGALGSGWPKGNVRAMAPTQIDGRTVFAIRYAYSLPRQSLGIPKEKTNAKMKRLSDDRYALCGDGSCKDGGKVATWKLRFEETAQGLRVFDDKTDRQLGLIAGASLDELYEGRETVGHRAFAIDGDTVVPIDSPWPRDPGWGTNDRGGQRVETVPPADAPANDQVRWVGNAWLAEDWSSSGETKRWLHLGGAWHSLEDAFGPGAGSSAAGLEDLTLLGDDANGLWVLLHPGAETK